MAFGDKKREQQMTDSMSAAITEGIAGVMRPVFEELTGQMREMMTGLQNQQAESMKVMADAFLEQMKKAADGMFADVTAGLVETVRQQQDATNKLNEAADKIAADSRLLAEAASKLSVAVSGVSEAAVSMDRVVKEQNKNVDIFVAQVEKYGQSSENVAKAMNDRQNEWIANYKTCDERLADTAGKAADTISAAAASLEKNIAGLKEACDALSNSTSTYADTVTRASETYGRKLDEGINQTFETFDTEMAGIAKTLGDAAANISEVTTQIPRTLKGSIDELERTIKR